MVEDKRASVADQVAAKMDVSAWFATLTQRMRQIAKDLAFGFSTSEVAGETWRDGRAELASCGERWSNHGWRSSRLRRRWPESLNCGGTSFTSAELSFYNALRTTVAPASS